MVGPRTSLIEVAFILPSAQNGTLGRYIKTEQATADDGDGRDEIDIADLIHNDGGAQWPILRPRNHHSTNITIGKMVR